MSFVDSLMDMLKNGKEDDGAATARNNLSQTWDYPSLVAALPYRYYDDRNEIFVNAGSAGFIMEAAPLPGANEQVMAALDDMLRKKLPRQTPVTVIMLASKCVGERIDRGVSNDMWKGGMAEHLNKITRAFWQRSALHGLANEREYPLYLRNYRIFIVYGQPIKRASQVQRVMDDLIQIRNTIRVSLGAARIDSMNTDVHAFLSAVREQMNYRQEQVLTSSGDYNEDEKLNRQVVDPGIDLKVHPSHIRMALPETIDARGTRLPASACRIINMQLAKNPRRFALWQGADNLQNLRFPDLGIPCPFMLTWTTALEEQTKSQSEAFRKDQDLSKKANSAYAALFPNTKKAAEEWRRTREQLHSNEIALCNTYFNLTLFAPDNRIDAALQRIETQPADRVARSASASLPGSAIQETETPVNDIVADWTDRTPEARSRTLIITQLNADRRAVNAGIHAVLAARGELGEKAITVPVLDKITHTRHEFNKTDAWEAGMVVKRGDRYQDVLAVDRNGSTVTVRDEEGKIGLYSPKELITGDVQLFRRSEREVRAGDLLKFTATDKEQGQMASQRYTVESVSETGNIRLKGENGRITINPQAVRAQQHIDYGWAVTGYGAQGASSDYVIALEGTEGGRKALAGT